MTESIDGKMTTRESGSADIGGGGGGDCEGQLGLSRTCYPTLQPNIKKRLCLQRMSIQIMAKVVGEGSAMCLQVPQTFLIP